MRFHVVTIFPELIDAFARVGLVAKAIDGKLMQVDARSPRAFASDRHNSVDDAPFGGGSGMVMMPEPIARTLEAIDAEASAAGGEPAHRVLLTPQGTPFAQRDARRLAQKPALALICGRY